MNTVSSASTLEESKKQYFRFDRSDFGTILQTSSFVDKTMLIKVFVEDTGGVVITAPRRFGKTTNLNMVKRFLEIEVDENGKKKSKVCDINEPVRDTCNYNLFVKYNLNITKEILIMDTHLGKHPIIHADFKCDKIINSFRSFSNHFKSVIHVCYKQHKYLLKSDELESEEKATVKLWCSNSSFKRIDEHNISVGLQTLSKYLFKHFHSKVCLLIDEYDSPVMKAMFRVKTESKLKHIVEFNVGIISNVVKNNQFVAHALLTGMSYIAGANIFRLNNIKAVRFLEDHPFVEFYGLTKQEVVKLLNKDELCIEEEAKQKVHATYNGYVSLKRNTTIYSLWSIIHFLAYREFEHYWRNSGYIKNLTEIFRIPIIKTEIEQLIQGNSISITFQTRITLKELVKLKNLILKPDLQEELSCTDLFFSFLLEQGYLTYESNSVDPGQTSVKVPNEEIRQEFISKLRNFYVRVCKLKDEYIDKCILFFKELSPSVDVENLTLFHKTLEQLLGAFHETDCIKLNEETVHGLMSFITYQGNFKCISEVTVNDGRVNLLLVREKFAVIIQFKYSKEKKEHNTSQEALLQIINKKYMNMFENRNLIPERIENYMLLGVCMDDNLKASCSWLVNTSNIEKVLNIPSSSSKISL